jgi:hypothetical protein
LRLAFQPRLRKDLCKLGSDYGGWIVPISLLSSSAICSCVGLGEDITFDLALIDTFGCEVYAFDPTPRAVRHVERTAKDVSRYHVLAVGLWSKNEVLKVFAFKRLDHVSHSVVNLENARDCFEVQCYRISRLMAS